jgi:hypothetical protein
MWGGLWRRIFKAHTERQHVGGVGRILKCKAHRTRADCEQGDPHDLDVWHGNGRSIMGFTASLDQNFSK